MHSAIKGKSRATKLTIVLQNNCFTTSLISRITGFPKITERDKERQFWPVYFAYKSALCTRTKALPVSDNSSKSNRDARPCNASTIASPMRIHPFCLASVAACIFARFGGDRRDKRRQKCWHEVVADTRDMGARHRRRSSRRRYSKNNEADPTVLFRSARVHPSIGHVRGPRCVAGRLSKSRANVTITGHSFRFSLVERRNFCNVTTCFRWYFVYSTVSRFPERSSLFSECSPARYALPKSRGERTKWVLFFSTWDYHIIELP